MKKLLILLLLFTGCNYKELNNIAIVSGISIDYNEQYEIDIMVSQNKNYIYHTKGKTISEAINKLNNIVPKELYLGHLDMIVISENASKKINTIIDYFLRDSETSKRFYLLMTKNKANTILKSISKLEAFPFNKISLDINSNKSLSNNITYSKFIESYLTKGKEPYIPVVKTYNKKYLTTIGLGLFKNNKFIGYTNNSEAHGINLLLGNSNKLIIKNKHFITSLTNIKVNKKIRLDNKPIIYITIKGNGNIEEIDKNITDSQIKKAVEKKLKLLLTNSINKTKDYNTDIIGFGNLIYKKHPNYFNKHKNYLKKSKIIIKTNIKIKRLNYENMEQN